VILKNLDMNVSRRYYLKCQGTLRNIHRSCSLFITP
jgi:hypothetical protein